ncbi:MAG: hypothetical protein MJZ68_00970 [archaeon]|nr:hypothetical protein [archaeon]
MVTKCKWADPKFRGSEEIPKGLVVEDFLEGIGMLHMHLQYALGTLVVWQFSCRDKLIKDGVPEETLHSEAEIRMGFTDHQAFFITYNDITEMMAQMYGKDYTADFEILKSIVLTQEYFSHEFFLNHLNCSKPFNEDLNNLRIAINMSMGVNNKYEMEIEDLVGNQ